MPQPQGVNIPQLPSAAPISGSDLFEVSRSNINYKTSAAALATYLTGLISVPSAANPTARVGLTVVNGTSSSYMRADAAPAAQQASNSVPGYVQGDGASFSIDGSGIGHATSTGVNVSSNSTASYTLVLSDANGYKRMNSGSAMSLIVPPNSSVPFPVGTTIGFEQEGTGVIGVVAGAGVTIVSTGGFLHTNGQYAVAQLIQKAVNVWTLYGNLVA